MALRCALVAGASGFIGRALCRALRGRDVRVTGLMRCPADGPWDDVLRLDLATETIPPRILDGIDVVFHLAGTARETSKRDPGVARSWQGNVEGTRSLVNWSVDAGIRRFVYLSSVKAMGEGGEGRMNEASDGLPETGYGRSKLEAERLVEEAGRARRLDTTILRLPLVYGQGSIGNLASMLAAVAARRFPPLPECHNKRSMVHVEDVAEAAILAASIERAGGQTYIITDGRTYSTREIYELMCHALGQEVPRWSVPITVLRIAARVGDAAGSLRGRRFAFDSNALRKLIGSAWYSDDKARQELGYRQRFTLEDALPAMAAEITGSRPPVAA